MAIEQEFQEAVKNSQLLTKKPGDDDLLLLYALFKQATEGDVKGDKPGGFDFKAMAKYAAWEEQKGKSSEDAKTAYVQLVNRLQKG